MYNRAYFIHLTVATTIIFGVWGLSAIKCTLLKDSLLEYGAPGYFAGNWLVSFTLNTSTIAYKTRTCQPLTILNQILVLQIHYYPALRIISCKRPKTNRSIRWNQCATSGVFFLSYLLLNDASKVYGCPYARIVISAASVLGITIVCIVENRMSAHFDAIAYSGITAPIRFSS